MLFSYEIRKENPFQFFFPAFKAYKSINFHFRLGTEYRSRRVSGVSRAVTSIQELLVSRFLYFWIVLYASNAGKKFFSKFHTRTRTTWRFAQGNHGKNSVIYTLKEKHSAQGRVRMVEFNSSLIQFLLSFILCITRVKMISSSLWDLLLSF